MMRFLRTVLQLILLLFVIGALAIIVVGTVMPLVPVPAVIVPATPDLASRGAYLFYHVSACVTCHSTRDQTLMSGPVVPGTEGGGGDAFNESAGVPGTIYGRNLTPAALLPWSDGEIARAITAGVGRHGNALFPLMPYQHYASATQKDVSALIAYLRSLKPIENVVPPRNLTFPMNLIVNLIPKAAHPEPVQPVVGTPEYGAYLVNLGACLHCHSIDHHGDIPPGMQFAGGRTFAIDGGTVRSSNLTSDKETGLGAWTKERFISAFAAFRQPTATIPVKPGEFNTPMPWSEYAGMTDTDLGAIFDYLHALPAVRNQVVKFSPTR